jgi:hypothetical protein
MCLRRRGGRFIGGQKIGTGPVAGTKNPHAINRVGCTPPIISTVSLSLPHGSAVVSDLAFDPKVSWTTALDRIRICVRDR